MIAIDTTPVITIEDFKKKYGSRGPGVMVGEFIKLTPKFSSENIEQGRLLCRKLGVMLADLESALIDVRKETQ